MNDFNTVADKILHHSEKLEDLIAGGGDEVSDENGEIAENKCDWYFMSGEVESGDDGHSGVFAGINMYARAIAAGHQIFYVDVDDYRYYFIAESEKALLAKAATWGLKTSEIDADEG